MAQRVAEAERQRQLSRQALAEHASALGDRVRHELDWQARLHRDGLRYAVIGTAVVVIATAVVLVRVSRRPKKESREVTVTSLADVAAQLGEIKAQLAKRGKDPGPLWQRLTVQAATAAAAGAGGVVARRLLERFGEASEGAPQPADRDGAARAGTP